MNQPQGYFVVAPQPPAAPEKKPSKATNKPKTGRWGLRLIQLLIIGGIAWAIHQRYEVSLVPRGEKSSTSQRQQDTWLNDLESRAALLAQDSRWDGTPVGRLLGAIGKGHISIKNVERMSRTEGENGKIAAEVMELLK